MMNSDLQLTGSRAIVTGAGSGFDAKIAQLYAQHGAKVLINDIDEAHGEQTTKAISAAGGEAIFKAGDVSVRADMQALVDTAVEHWNGVDILVNNAGITHSRGSLLEVDEASFDRIYAVNVKSIYLSALAVVPQFRKQQTGVILNIASTAGVRPRPGLTWYNGSKGAVITLSKSMAVELAPDRIRVNALNPVMGVTGLLEDFLGSPDSPAARAKIIETIPLGRLSMPEDIAKAALFLVSEQASFITGVCLDVDGGRCI